MFHTTTAPLNGVLIGKKNIALAAAFVMSCTVAVHAGTTGAEFQGLYDLLFGWMQGFLARAIALAASIAGAFYGLAKQNPLLGITGVIFAVILSVGPGVINGILTAVI